MTIGVRDLVHPGVYKIARKYLRSYPEWGFNPPRINCKRQLTQIGSEYGGYFLDPSIVPQEPVIYSVGIGKDISFDLSLIERYGCTIHGFDPTPEVRSWLEAQNLPAQFHFHSFGIADFDGDAKFFLPPRADFISHSIIGDQFSANSVHLPVMKLKTAMLTLGHERIDILKIDIEGAEYSVLADLIKDKIEVQQILVEFHHRLSSVGVEKTRAALAALSEYGMKICHICPRMEVITLVAA